MPKPPFLPKSMLRLSTIATISIASILSIASICDARSVQQTANYQVSRQSRPYALAKQSKVSRQNTLESDLKNIQQVISERYVNKNKVLENIASTSRRFYEVKSLKLISFSDTKAQIEVEENIRGYDFRNSQYISQQKSDIFDNSASGHTKHVFNISLEKSAGKWKINNRLK